MRPNPKNIKEELQGQSDGEEPENEGDGSSSSGEDDTDDENVEESDNDDGDEEEIAAHEARMEVLREENRRLVAIGEECDRQIDDERQQRDDVQQRISDLEMSIRELRRRRDNRD